MEILFEDVALFFNNSGFQCTFRDSFAVPKLKTKMAALSLSSLRFPYLHRIYEKQFLSVTSLPRPSVVFALSHASSSLRFNPLGLAADRKEMVMAKQQKNRGSGVVCHAAPLTARNLQWISTVSSVILMLARGTAVHKSFLVPLFALQAPSSIISWIKGEYGIWAAFLALLVRLFFFIPGELELTYAALLLVIVAPYQVMNLRGTQEGAIVSLLITGYLAFQHFSRAGSLQKAFDQGSIVATLAIVCITAVSFLLLI